MTKLHLLVTSVISVNKKLIEVQIPLPIDHKKCGHKLG